MSMSDEYVCALSGRTANKEEKAPIETGDELEDLPIGWSKLTIQTRVLNPDFIAIQQLKESIVAEFLSNIPEDKKEEAKPVFEIQTAAQYAALEAQTSPYLIDERICYISNPESSEATEKEWQSLLERLDLQEEDS